MVASPTSAARCIAFPAPPRGFDPSISCDQSRPLASILNSENIKAIHDAFQLLCEGNTNRIDKEFAASTSGMGCSRDDLVNCSTTSKRFSPEFEPVTVFHSKTLAKLSLIELGRIMMRSVGCLEEMLAVTVILSARYCVSAEVKPTTHLMHRLYVACLQVALKAHSDHYYRNSHYAYLAGISANEMNRQESELLRGMCWSVQVTARQVESTLNRVASGKFLPVLAHFAVPAEPFESLRSHESSFSLSHQTLSQSNMELPRYPANASLAEQCPRKINEVMSRAERPLNVSRDRIVSRELDHVTELKRLQEDLERGNESPRSVQGSGSDDDDDDDE